MFLDLIFTLKCSFEERKQGIYFASFFRGEMSVLAGEAKNEKVDADNIKPNFWGQRVVMIMLAFDFTVRELEVK